ncbi:response regulator transcription factor [Tannerella forsythia]|uniref:DNA-binding response regulator n=1 Tax=Tannerella forsythia TaxID=28112 RepID=A0A3P1XLF5_TANFO|nr:response regulator transcription factor [Tannerella forsythia]RRD59609.1 DNA-binding response regulator [Tannerella forsythia]
MEKMHILVVDDEESLCEILKFNLEKAGYAVDTVLSAEEALTMNLTDYHLILLDVMMGEISGFQMADILKKKKETAHIPIIFCTAKDTEDDTVYGLQLGADDYISKPFSIREVLARVETVLRRNTRSVSEPPSENIRQYENLRLDTASKRASLGGRDVSLTKTEFEILWVLLQNPGRVYSRDSLLRTVWPDDVLVTDRTVDVHIARMRKKIAPYDKRIVTRLGYGYCFEG